MVASFCKSVSWGQCCILCAWYWKYSIINHINQHKRWMLEQWVKQKWIQIWLLSSLAYYYKLELKLRCSTGKRAIVSKFIFLSDCNLVAWERSGKAEPAWNKTQQFSIFPSCCFVLFGMALQSKQVLLDSEYVSSLRLTVLCTLRKRLEESVRSAASNFGP